MALAWLCQANLAIVRSVVSWNGPVRLCQVLGHSQWASITRYTDSEEDEMDNFGICSDHNSAVSKWKEKELCIVCLTQGFLQNHYACLHLFFLATIFI